MPKKLERKVDDKWIAGVCAGIGAYFQVNPIIVRALFVFLSWFWGLPIIIYIVLAIALPQEQKRIPFNPASNPQYPEPTIRQNFSSQPITLIDINNGSEQELSVLPGLTSLQVKQLIKAREKTRGGFKTIEEMGEVLGLKPHILVQIKPIVQVSPRQNRPSSDQPGRRVDV